MPKEPKQKPAAPFTAQENALAAAVKAAVGSSVSVTDDGQRLRVTASATQWDGLWPKLAEVKPLAGLRWEGCEQGDGKRTCIWVR